MPTDSLARRLIYKHRMRLGLSPEQYARMIGCSGGTVRRVERGYTPFLHNQFKFAAALGMEREDLWGLPPIAEVRDRVRVAA
jgi:transcriptional regulator with XRE-family HTH domain